MKKALVDVSQFVNEPAATGIQRVLVELVKHLGGQPLSVSCLYENEEFSPRIIGANEFQEIAQTVFDRSFQDTERASKRLKNGLKSVKSLTAGSESITNEFIWRRFDCYLMPEITHNYRILDRLEYGILKFPNRTFMVAHDAFPQLHPEFWPHPTQSATSRYFLLLSMCAHVSCNSSNTKQHVVRLRRNTDGDLRVHLLGAEASKRALTLKSSSIASSLATSVRSAARPITSKTNDVNRVVMIGSIQDRKQTNHALDAMQIIARRRHDVVLEIIGREGSDTKAVERLRNLGDLPVKWFSDASDEELAEKLSTADLAMYVPRDEGYGLPAIEALAFGVPLIVTRGVPSTDDLAPGGRITVPTADPKLIADAIETALEPETNARLRLEIQSLSIPTWPKYASEVREWILETLNN